MKLALAPLTAVPGLSIIACSPARTRDQVRVRARLGTFWRTPADKVISQVVRIVPSIPNLPTQFLAYPYNILGVCHIVTCLPRLYFFFFLPTSTVNASEMAQAQFYPSASWLSAACLIGSLHDVSKCPSICPISRLKPGPMLKHNTCVCHYLSAHMDCQYYKFMKEVLPRRLNPINNCFNVKN